MFLPLQTSPLTHGRTISLPCSQEGVGNGANLARPQLRWWHNHHPHQQPLDAAPWPMQSCRDGSCRMQTCLWGPGLLPPQSAGLCSPSPGRAGHLRPRAGHASTGLGSLFPLSVKGQALEHPLWCPDLLSQEEGEQQGGTGAEGCCRHIPERPGPLLPPQMCLSLYHRAVCAS